MLSRLSLYSASDAELYLRILTFTLAGFLVLLSLLVLFEEFGWTATLFMIFDPLLGPLKIPPPVGGLVCVDDVSAHNDRLLK